MGPLARGCLAALAVAAAGCDGKVADALAPRPFPATVTPVAQPLRGAPGFAHEWGGGLFLDPEGALVRLRADGSRAPLESHPANPVAPGAALAVWPLGPSTALVATATGLFVEDAGWLVAPPWQAQLPAEGLVGVAVAADGVAWLAHAQGVFRLAEGALSQLTVDGAPVTEVTAVAVGPGPDGRPGIWYARGGALFSVAQTGAADFAVRPSGLSAADLKGGVAALAGLTPSPSSPGEVWASTPSTLWRFTQLGWRHYEVPAPPTQLLSAGRFVWLVLGGRLYRFDGDAEVWGEATGLGEVPALLAADATGAAWARLGEATAVLSDGEPARLLGLFESEAVFEAERLFQAALPLAAAADGPSEVSFAFDGEAPRPVDLAGHQGAGALAGLRLFSLGGVDALGAAQRVSLAALGDGAHTLQVRAAFADGRAAALRTHFTLSGTEGAVLSFERDLAPLNASRCLKCHGVATAPELKTYAQWKANADAIVAAVKARRMPADGPMAPASVAAIERWVTGGMQP